MLPIARFCMEPKSDVRNIDWLQSLHHSNSITDEQLENWEITAIEVRYEYLEIWVTLLGIDNSRLDSEILEIRIIIIASAIL